MRQGTENGVGSQVRRIREGKNLSLRELGERTGMDHGNLSKLERGLMEPKVSTLHRLAKALGVRVGKLLDAA